jgi:hypothetical protein
MTVEFLDALSADERAEYERIQQGLAELQRKQAVLAEEAKRKKILQSFSDDRELLDLWNLKNRTAEAIRIAEQLKTEYLTKVGQIGFKISQRNLENNFRLSLGRVEDEENAGPAPRAARLTHSEMFNLLKQNMTPGEDYKVDQIAKALGREGLAPATLAKFLEGSFGWALQLVRAPLPVSSGKPASERAALYRFHDVKPELRKQPKK